jgi:peptide/nickel transport system ATP-binding protein
VIPPEDVDLEQGAWRGVLDLRNRLESRGVDLDAVRTFVAAEHDVPPEDAPADALAAAVRDEFRIPERLSEPAAERTLAEALEALVAGDREAATERLADAFPTVCESRHPELATTSPGHRAACHLNDPTLPGVPADVESVENPGPGRVDD